MRRATCSSFPTTRLAVEAVRGDRQGAALGGVRGRLEATAAVACGGAGTLASDGEAGRRRTSRTERTQQATELGEAVEAGLVGGGLDVAPVTPADPRRRLRMTARYLTSGGLPVPWCWRDILREQAEREREILRERQTGGESRRKKRRQGEESEGEGDGILVVAGGVGRTRQGARPRVPGCGRGRRWGSMDSGVFLVVAGS